MDGYKTKLTDNLVKAVLCLKNKEECYAFFDDICTIKEMQDIAQRLEVATLLNEGHPYNDIAKKTGASTATISRVNKCITYGSGGYKLVLERLYNKKDKE